VTPFPATSSATDAPSQQRASFLAELSEPARRRVVEEFVAAVAGLGEAFDPGVVLLAAYA